MIFRESEWPMSRDAISMQCRNKLIGIFAAVDFQMRDSDERGT